MRQSLHIHIDPSPFDPEVIISPDSTSPSPESARLSAGTARTTPTSTSSDQEEISVLCMHDFRAADSDQLSFRKNEILLIVKRENTGWWAAMRKGGDVIGWVPQAFVTPLTEEMAERLSNVREELRIYEYGAEQLYSAPLSRNDYIFDSEPEPEAVPRRARTFQACPRIVKSPDRNGCDQRQGLHYTGVNPSSGPLDAHKSHRRHTSPDPLASFDISFRRPRTADKTRKPVPIEDYSQPVLVLQASLPRYLQPRFAEQLDVDADGHVRNGSVPALIERLMATNIDNKHYQDVFLMTFRSFMTADVLFDALVEYYNLPQPGDLTVSELEDWLERGKRKTQRKVLEIFSDWLQSNHLLEEEPHIAGRLTEFLQSITSGPNAKVSKLIQARIQDLTFSIGSPVTISPSSASRKKRGSKPQKGELLKIEASDIAEQLSVILYDMYKKILPNECILYAKSKQGSHAANLREFCASHDKVTCWVQMSILTIETMKRRAETVDYWIKVAEKCRVLNNISAMSSIITALSSTVITRLPLTWAHVSKKSTLDSLLRYNDPSGSFATYRNLNSVDGPCVPFIVMHFTELAHIQDQYNDKESRVCFYKRKRFYEVLSTMLRHQKEPYALVLDDVAVFIRNHLQDPPDPRWLWKKSEDVQLSELQHADIRKGLEKAGF
ncbi:ras GEF [Macrolepiota fuliginosa MF-IS2]|uniref:Ras GEF n=1 Tax=Macrolepiota fuliginosa MF-IS2 TaxID=1400762 RepID=A0A9P6BY08_9AGAR|nr:ras GEF [Macrolepiota fuliginosa MF-IS2]